MKDQINNKIETAQKINLTTTEDKLYKQRAIIALPILIRQALAKEPITYQNLAQEMGIKRPLNLNYVLGHIGKMLMKLGEENNRKIPFINCLVLNKNTGLPGDGIGWFMTQEEKEDYSKLTKSQQRDVIKLQLAKIFAFPDWYWVLGQFDMTPIKPKPKTEVDQLVKQAKIYKGGGESPAHKLFKEYIAQHPEAIGLTSLGKGQTEYALYSLDSIDVVFIDKDLIIGIEVKSKISPPGDIFRGLFQCVKYRCLLEAQQAVHGKIPNCRIILVLEGRFPNNLVRERNILGIEVIDNVAIQENISN